VTIEIAASITIVAIGVIVLVAIAERLSRDDEPLA